MHQVGYQCRFGLTLSLSVRQLLHAARASTQKAGYVPISVWGLGYCRNGELKSKMKWKQEVLMMYHVELPMFSRIFRSLSRTFGAQSVHTLSRTPKLQLPAHSTTPRISHLDYNPVSKTLNCMTGWIEKAACA